MAAEAGMATAPDGAQAVPEGDTEMSEATGNGAQAEAGRRPAESDADSISKRKRLKLELEPLPVDRVEKINPDGTFSLLPPENPEEIFARKVAFLRKENAEKKAEEEAAKSGPKKQGFLWKESVDGVRVAAHHAQQLSAFLKFLSDRTLSLHPAAHSHVYSAKATLEGKIQNIERARTQLSEVIGRMKQEIKVDSKFVDGLKELRANWNVRPIGRQPQSNAPMAAQVGALGVNLSILGSAMLDDVEGVVLRRSNGAVQVKMGPDFKLRENVILVDPEHVPGAEVAALAGLSGCPAPVGRRAGVDQYLWRCLRSVLDHEVYRLMYKDALSAHVRQNTHLSRTGVVLGPVVVSMLETSVHDRPAGGEGEEGAKQAEAEAMAVDGEGGEGGSAKSRGDADGEGKEGGAEGGGAEGGGAEGGGGVVGCGVGEPTLAVVARQLVRLQQRQKLKPKPSQGGQVPRKPLVATQIANMGVLLAVDAIARHRLLRSAVVAVLEECATGAVCAKALGVAFHRLRSERANLSRMLLELDSPMAAPGGQRRTVHIGVQLRDVTVTVAVTPAVIGPGGDSSKSQMESPEAVKMVVQSTMANLLIQGLQTEAEAQGSATHLSSVLVGAGEAGALQLQLRLWRPGALPDEGDADTKLLRLTMGKDGETLTVEHGGQTKDWDGVAGQGWRDRLRRLVLLW